ncbi:hypothetical protein RRG08_018719 [Elysia crispata]|uniref:Uncharacterized protein n=1 Tax=Elysia crispata TaxID=231223 RepID=A0AAE0YG28_9GAST|nr:hypothetical protein RRG08_018719 [Elysia crispata]
MEIAAVAGINFSLGDPDQDKTRQLLQILVFNLWLLAPRGTKSTLLSVKPPKFIPEEAILRRHDEGIGYSRTCDVTCRAGEAEDLRRGIDNSFRQAEGVEDMITSEDAVVKSDQLVGEVNRLSWPGKGIGMDALTSLERTKLESLFTRRVVRCLTLFKVVTFAACQLKRGQLDPLKQIKIVPGQPLSTRHCH